MGTKTKQKNLKKPTHTGPADRVSALSTKCGACHPKGLIFASSCKIKQKVIIAILALMCQC